MTTWRQASRSVKGKWLRGMTVDRMTAQPAHLPGNVIAEPPLIHRPGQPFQPPCGWAKLGWGMPGDPVSVGGGVGAHTASIILRYPVAATQHPRKAALAPVPANPVAGRSE